MRVSQDRKRAVVGFMGLGAAIGGLVFYDFNEKETL
jgi:hypothetical protein